MLLKWVLVATCEEDVLFFVGKLWNVVIGMEEHFKLAFLFEK